MLGCFAGVRVHGVLAVNMETNALYTVEAHFGAKALSICTVVDSLVKGENTDSKERKELLGERGPACTRTCNRHKRLRHGLA